MIIIPPILDLILTGGTGAPIAYMFLPHKVKVSIWEIIKTFVTFKPFNLIHGPEGMSIGIRIETWILHFCEFIYVYVKSKNILKSSVFVLFSYFLLYVMGILPTLTHFLEKSLISLHVFTPYTQGDMTFYSFIIFFVMVLVLFKIAKPETFHVLFKNLKWNYMIHYLLMFLFGVLAGIEYDIKAINRLNLMDLFALLVSIFGCWVFSIAIKNRFQEERVIDNNSEKSLICRQVKRSDYSYIAVLSGLVGVISALCVGYKFLLAPVLALGISVLYYSPPLNIKKIPVLNQLIAGMTSILVVIQGFVFSGEKVGLSFRYIPLNIVMGVLVVFTLGASVKNLKTNKSIELESDLKPRGRQIPVYPKILVVIMLISAFFLWGVLLKIDAIWYFFIAFLLSLFNLYVILKGKRIVYVFITYYIMIGLTIVFLMQNSRSIL
ncbi:hypothetical protein JXI42_09250 [bacterium]|nr:hypothetical protein [bacterium]